MDKQLIITEEELLSKIEECQFNGNIYKAKLYYKMYIDKGFQNKNILVSYANISLEEGNTKIEAEANKISMSLLLPRYST